MQELSIHEIDTVTGAGLVVGTLIIHAAPTVFVWRPPVPPLDDPEPSPWRTM
ncbi:MAG: hypothetical protein V4582_23275 [Pseudomonadota bacterium]